MQAQRGGRKRGDIVGSGVVNAYFPLPAVTRLTAILPACLYATRCAGSLAAYQLLYRSARRGIFE